MLGQLLPVTEWLLRLAEMLLRFTASTSKWGICLFDPLQTVNHLLAQTEPYNTPLSETAGWQVGRI